MRIQWSSDPIPQGNQALNFAGSLILIGMGFQLQYFVHQECYDRSSSKRVDLSELQVPPEKCRSGIFSDISTNLENISHPSTHL